MRPVRAALILSLVLASTCVVFVTSADAKLCHLGSDESNVVLDGLPAQPVAAVSYDIEAALFAGNAVNPQPFLANPQLLFVTPHPRLVIQSCGAREEFDRPEELSLPIDWVRSEFRFDDWVRSEFRLTFPTPGRWHVAFVDLNGTLDPVGVYEVGAAPAMLGPRIKIRGGHGRRGEERWRAAVRNLQDAALAR